jgi:TolA-binding protein
MNKPTTSGDDLLILARRGELSEAEQRRLDVYLGASLLSRALYQLGVHYDAVPQEQRNDADTIGRVITAVCEQKGGTTARRSRRGWLIGVVAALSSVTAAAATVTVARWAARAPAPASVAAPSAGGLAPARTKLGGAPDPRSDAAAPTHVSNPGSVPSATSGSSAQIPQLRRSDRAPSTSSRTAESDAARMTGLADVSRPAETAGQMFSEANTLRKAGRVSEAERAYRHLQQLHAGSPEASVSHVLLGRILLRQGRSAAACTEFEQYLAEQSRGNLAEEALQGDAMCTRALGRPAAERAVWQTLLSRFPSSIYADAARQRLKDLDGARGALP